MADQETTNLNAVEIKDLTEAPGLVSDLMFPCYNPNAEDKAQRILGSEIIDAAQQAGKEAAGALTRGATFTPAVSEDGTISWTNDQGLKNPESVQLPGVASFNGRMGAVTPQSGDYSMAQITGLSDALSKKVDAALPTEYDLPATDGLTSTSTYCKTMDGFVFSRIYVKNTAGFANGDVLATFPSGYRPALAMAFTGIINDGSAGACSCVPLQVTAAGALTCKADSSLTLIRASVIFRGAV